jgi:hypothetical protein
MSFAVTQVNWPFTLSKNTFFSRQMTLISNESSRSTISERGSTSNCFEVVQTSRSLRLCLGTGNSREQQSGKNGDDRNNHQQFNQRESIRRFEISSHAIWTASRGVAHVTCQRQFAWFCFSLKRFAFNIVGVYG